MTRDVSVTNQFKRDIKKHAIELVTPQWIEVMHCLINELPLPKRYCDHQLQGSLKQYRDRHIKPDLVLLYELFDDVIILHRLGSHSELAI